jgi:hypothetical protein
MERSEGVERSNVTFSRERDFSIPWLRHSSRNDGKPLTERAFKTVISTNGTQWRSGEISRRSFNPHYELHLF